MYALNSESKDPVAPDVVMTTVPPGRANDDAAAAGGTGRANENAAVGDAGGETAAAPAPTVANEALRNASAEQAEDEGNGGCYLVLFMFVHVFMPRTGRWVLLDRSPATRTLHDVTSQYSTVQYTGERSSDQQLCPTRTHSIAVGMFTSQEC